MERRCEVSSGAWENLSMPANSDHVLPPLRLIRVARGMAQADLAAEIGISLSSVSNIENGRKRPDEELRSRLAHALGCSANVVAGESDFALTWIRGRVRIEDVAASG